MAKKYLVRGIKAQSLVYLDKFDEAWDIIDFVSNKFLNFEDICHLKAFIYSKTKILMLP